MVMNYIFKILKKDEVNDAWLDNIDWANVNSFKNSKPQVKADENESGDEEDEDEPSEKESDTNAENKSQIEILKKMVNFLKPGENVLKAIKRLGDGSKSNGSGSSSIGLSASQRWLKKKNQEQDQKNIEPQKAKENKESLELLTGYANYFIDNGFYDIYQETREKIEMKIKNAEETKADSFDIFADEADVAASSSKHSNLIQG